MAFGVRRGAAVASAARFGVAVMLVFSAAGAAPARAKTAKPTGAASASSTPAASPRAVRPPRQLLWYRYREPRPLTLDPNRIALRGARGADVAALGLTATGAQSIGGAWSLAELPRDRRSAEGVETTIETAAQRVPFVSPVFLDDLGGPLTVTDEILVRFDPGVSPAHAEALVAAAGAGMVAEHGWGKLSGACRITSGKRDGFAVLDAANRLARLPGVRFAEPSMRFTGSSLVVPNDAGFANCWGLENTGQTGGVPDMDIDAPEAWDVTTGDPSIGIVIIDTGVQLDHPDLNAIAGADVTDSPGAGDGSPVNQCDSHGTLVAGAASAMLNNSIGTVGAAPGAPAISVRTFISNTPSCNGLWTTQTSWTVDALAYAESIGARITNNSNFYGFTSAAIEDKYAQTRAAGMIHFAAAGNTASSAVTYPASIDSVIAVSAIDATGAIAWFSNYGADIEFTAPGDQIYSTDRTGSAGFGPGDWLSLSGTSLASPYAAGVAALVLARHPGLDPDALEAVLRESAVNLGAPGWDIFFGWGLLNANQAVLSDPCVADIDDNDNVSFGDLVELLMAWGACTTPAVACPGDIDGNGDVGFSDLVSLLMAWGPCG